MSNGNPEAETLIEQLIANSPFAAHLGMRVQSLEPDVARIAMPFKDELVTIGDIVHGGAISALLDTAATAAAWSTPNPPENLRGTTVSITVTFVAAARAQDLTATARVVRRGRSLCFCEVEATDASGQLVAKALVTYKLG
jgi:uncharacterized protein (TIGR00369 family)